MMRKRIQILSFTLVFLISTTGLPVTYHLCDMMGETSLTECEMCKPVVENVQESCCSMETEDYPISISSSNSECCKEHFIYNKVEDEFLFNKSEIYSNSSLKIILDFTIQNLNEIENHNSFRFFTDSSPPFLINSDLNILNSTLLI